MQRLRTISLAATTAFSLMLLGSAALAQPQPDQQADQAKPDQAKPDQAKPDQAKKDGDTPRDGQAMSLSESSEPTAEDIENAKQAFIAGNQLFQVKDYENAVIKFKEAYRLSKNPLLLYNIGFTLDMQKKADLALFYYEKFLTDAGPKARVYDEVKARVEAIKKAKEAESVFDSGSMGAIQDQGKPQVTGFQHKVVEETPPGMPLDVTAFIPEASGWQVTLYYRAAGEDRFDSTLMRPRYNELVGRIPATKTNGASLQYYIEVRDKTGKIIERSGRSASPNLIFVDPEAKPRYYPDLDQEMQIDTKAEVTPAKPEDTQTTSSPTSGGLSDVDSGLYQYAKWGATGVTIGMVGLWITFNRSAANMAISLENEKELSSSAMSPTCVRQEPPCRAFSEFQKEVERRGRRYETLSYVSLGVGALTAGVAGYLWYREIKEKQRRRNQPADDPDAADTDSKVTAVPVVGRDFIGGAALLTF